MQSGRLHHKIRIDEGRNPNQIADEAKETNRGPLPGRAPSIRLPATGFAFEASLPAPIDSITMQQIRLDLTNELNLRRWARVPASRRSATWHSIVLEEMCCRDAELADQMGSTTISARYVPLPPGRAMP
jgi:hypothetical protein